MKYEIIHDTIALQVFEKASIEARTRRKVEKYIAERYEAYQQRGAQLDQDDLDYISPYLDQVNISPEESAFIRKGAAALQKAKRRRQALILGVIAILAIFLAVALFQWRSAAASRAEAEASALKADSSAVVANKAKEDALEQARIAKEKEEEAAAQKKLADEKADEALAAEARATTALGVANKARSAAEKSFRKAKAESLGALSQLLLEQNPTKSLRVAQKAYEYADGTPSLVLLKAMMEAKTKPLYNSLEHGGTVSSVDRFGNRLLTASWDQSVRIWSEDGKLLQTLKGHTDHVSVARFSRNGDKILSASWDGTARLWDSQGNLLKVLKGHEGALTKAIFAGNEQILTGGRDNKVILWNYDGQKIATLAEHGCSENGACGITTILVSPDKQQIFTASFGSEANVWDRQGNLLFQLNGHEGSIVDAEYSADGSRLVTGSTDQTAMLWDAQTGEQIAVFQGHTNHVNAVCMTGNYIATASDDGKAGIWKLGTGTNEGELIRLSREIISNVVASPSGEVLALSDDGTAYLIDPDEARVIEHLRGHDGPLLAAAIYDGGQSILTCSRDNTARIWDLGGLQIGKTIVHEDGNRMMSSSFSPNGGFILSTNGNTKLWALDGTLKNTMIGETHSVFSRDGQMILTAGYSGERNRLYNSVGESLKELNLRQFRVYFTPENNLLTDDGGVYSQNEELLYSLNGHGSRTNSATYSPDGAYVVTASWDESAILWKKDGTLMQRLTGHTDRVNSGDISPDQKWILTTSADQTIKLWDFAGNLVRTYGGHGCGDNDFSGGTAGDCGINDGQFSPTGRFFATGGDDGVLIMRDLEGTLVSTIQGHKRAIIALDFSTQGDKIMTAGHDNEIKIWYTPAGIADWLETAEIDQLSPQDRLKYNIEG